AGLALTASPDRFRLRPGGKVTIQVKASFQGTPAPGAPAEGAIQIGSRSTLPLRIPWAIPFGRYTGPLLSSVSLSKTSFKPSDTTPAVLSFRAGALSPGTGGTEVHPVGRLDMVLANSSGTHLGLLVRMRDLLPGSYAFGLTGRDPNGNTLPAGDYTLALAAIPPDGSRATYRKVVFTIQYFLILRPLFAAIFPFAARRRSVSDHTRSPRITPAREPVRHRQGAAAPRRAALRRRPEPRQRAARVQEGCRRLGPRDHGRRHHPGARGLSGHSQHRARTVEGGHPLPPGRRARRGEGARDVDDVEMRADGHSVWRGQGRHSRRPEEALAGRAATNDTPLHERDHQRDRAGEGHPGAGRRHQRRRDGVELRHLLNEQGPLGPRRGDRQAAERRRLARQAGGNSARGALLHPGSRP